MIYIKNLEDGVELFKALGSEVRVNIIRLLLKNTEMNMNEIAASLNITNGALTSHIKKMEDAGLIKVISDFSGHGNQKVCRVREERILVDIAPEEGRDNTGIYEAEVPVGQYMDYKVYPTCGISTAKSLIGEADDPRYFSHPDRTQAGILWFSKGYVEYQIPNLLPAAQKIDEITFTMELSSEAPGVNNDWPSDITISVNTHEIGILHCKGDFGGRKGVLNPDWWYATSSQYVELRTFEITDEACYIDGIQVSRENIYTLGVPYGDYIKFRLESKRDARYCGGFNLFGEKFGDYPQDIVMELYNDEKE